jgi:hypothetical protein
LRFFANAGIEGPLAKSYCEWSFGFDIRFADSWRGGSEYQIRSTSRLSPAISAVRPAFDTAVSRNISTQEVLMVTLAASDEGTSNRRH